MRADIELSERPSISLPPDVKSREENTREPSLGLSESDLPALSQALGERSASAQRGVLLAVKVGLGGSLIAAGLGLISVQWEGINYFAAGAAAAFLAALLSSSWLIWKKPDRGWYDARAGAESIKTLAWQYAVGGGEFPKGGDGEKAARALLVSRMREVLMDLGTLDSVVAASQPQVTDRMIALRESSLQVREAAYRSGRIDDQRRWYQEKAEWNAKRRTAWVAATVGLQVIGLAAGIGRAFFGLDVDLLGLAAAAVAASTAWTRTKDYSELAEAYARTSQEIGLVVEEMPASPGEAQWAEFVSEAERAFSREHTLWRARKGHRDVSVA